MSSGFSHPSTLLGSATAYPPSVLRPAQSEGTLGFLLMVALLGAITALAWRMRQQRSTSLKGIPDASPLPLNTSHETIHDPKYLSRILPDEDSAAS